MQCTHFHAKSAKNDLKPTNFLKRNVYFEMEGVNENYGHLLGSNGSLELDGYYTCEEVLKTYSSLSFIQARCKQALIYPEILKDPFAFKGPMSKMG